MAEENQAGAAPDQPQFALQRIYVKDLSFEAPQGPQAFQKQWRPQVQLDLNTTTNKIDEQNYEVVLRLTITAKQEEETAFLIEVHQGGIFACEGFRPPTATPGPEHHVSQYPLPLCTGDSGQYRD